MSVTLSGIVAIAGVTLWIVSLLISIKLILGDDRPFLGWFILYSGACAAFGGILLLALSAF